MSRAHALPLSLAMLVGAVLLSGAALRLVGASAHQGVPPAATPAAAPLSDGPVPAAITSTTRRGRYAVTLTITPVDVGPVRIIAAVREGGAPLTDGRVRIRLSMPAQPIFGVAVLRTKRCAGGYCAQGKLQALGRWRAEVLVRPHATPNGPIIIPFDIMNGANARFLFAQRPDTRFGPATVTLSRAADGSYAARVRLRPRLTVRAVLAMPNMPSMGTAIYPAAALARGWYATPLAFPMTGVTQVEIEVRVRSRWRAVRTLLYDVSSTGNATLLTNTTVGP